MEEKGPPLARNDLHYPKRDAGHAPHGGGFLAALIAILMIGVSMDLQGAGTPETYSLDAFRIAFLTQVPLWIIGSWGIIRERSRTIRHVGGPGNLPW